MTDPAPTPPPAPPPTPPAELVLPSPEPSPTPTPSPEGSWLDTLPEELKGDATLQRFKDVPSLAKSYVEARKKIGEQGLKLPGDDASLQEIREKMTALGCPESVEKYDLGDFAPPEGMPWSPEFQTDALAAMHQHGLNSPQARGMLGWFTQASQAAFQAEQQAQEKIHGEWDAKLAEKWGAAIEERSDLAERTIRHALGDEAAAVAQARLPDGGLLRHHPGFRDLLATAGALLAEHRLLGDAAPTRFANTPDQAIAALEEFNADAGHREALMNPRHPKHAEMVEKRRELYQQAYPGEATTGASSGVATPA